MIDVRQIESLLKINGLAKGAPDEQIRSVLLSARFKEDEVDTALMVLRENTTTKQTTVDGLHKVFRSDQGLRPDEISRLLGIDVTITERVINEHASSGRSFSILQFMVMWIVSVIIATSGLLLYMYYHDMGVFRPAINVALQ